MDPAIKILRMQIPNQRSEHSMTPIRLIVTAFESKLGFIAFAADAAGVLDRIWFDYFNEGDLRSAIRANIDASCQPETNLEFDDRAQTKLVRRFKKFASGNIDTFADVQINGSWMTAFQRRVVGQARRIPYGKTLSYGALARKSGCPGAARAVGSVMAKNRFPLIVPCHRVVASGRRLGGFSSVHGLTTKSRLLQLEGAINEKGALIE